MIKKVINIRTDRKDQMKNITSHLRDFIRENGIQEGRLTVFVPHTTAAVTINENADPTVQSDMLYSLDKISPDYPAFRHMEGNSDAHVKSSLIGCSQDVFVFDGSLMLGTWQGVYFCEFDGPRSRKFYIVG